MEIIRQIRGGQIMKKIKWFLGVIATALMISAPCYAGQWSMTYGGSYWDYPGAIGKTADGSYIIGGNTYSFGAGGYDIWVLKLNSDGDVIWQNTYGGIYGDSFDSIVQTTEGGYVVSGVTSYSNDIDADSDIWIIKLDAAGNVIWDKTYGRGSADYLTSAQEALDLDGSPDGWIVAGMSYSDGTGYDMWVLRLDSDGNIV
jgi:hypothetical protein